MPEYFNLINKPVTFDVFKQRKTKAVTTYLGCFHKNLHQIQTIQADYFTVPQILNQFIKGLCSSILQYICLLHPADLQAAVINTRDFEAAELEANHAQAVNLVMNGSSELNSKLKQFISYGSLKCIFVTTVVNKTISELTAILIVIHNWKINTKIPIADFRSELSPKSRSILIHLSVNDTTADLSTTSICTSNLLTINTDNLSTTVPSNLSTTNHSKLEISDGCLPTDSQLLTTSNRIIYLSLLITSEDTQSHNPEFNQQSILTNNIPSATIMEDKLLTAIFLFKIDKSSEVLLFNGAAFKEKPITVMYTNTKVNSQSIKLILDNGSIDNIITKQLMNQLGCQVDCTASTKIITADRITKTSIGKIDNFPIEVNNITVPIKVLLQISQNDQHMQVPVTCGYFRPSTITRPLIDFKKKKKNLLGKPIKYCALMKTTMNYCQYSPGMTTEKKNKRKNLLEMQTKFEKLTITQTNCQPENGKKPTKRKEKKKKKTYPKEPPPQK
ncbi:hypothetical protein G9A89_021965 [Geosiphon pyriformis]|nr:hypothetical protein G9A89_021965 [Geosiphon pyriformis]